jgi:chromosome segregation protein
MQSWQSAWDEFNQQAAQPRQQAEVQQSRIQHLEHSLSRLQSAHGAARPGASSAGTG